MEMQPASQPHFQRSPVPRSGVPGVTWPGVLGLEGSQILATLYQLEQSQWWSAAELFSHQLRQLQPLIRHAYDTTPFYRARFDQAGFDPTGPLTRDRWAQVPILTRRDLQIAGDNLLSRQVPKAHGAVEKTQTSGSTGQPVEVYCTGLTNFFWRVFTLRDHHWRQRNFQGRLAVIRASSTGADLGSPPYGKQLQSWGPPVSLLYDTGPAITLNLSTDVKAQAVWLQQQNPDYLLTYPSNLRALAEVFQATGAALPQLREIRTIGEMLPPATREACRQTWGVKLTDVYSSQEVGYIAIQCPVCENYHVQAEGVLVEILDQRDRPCQPGEPGRVVVTSLHNFAMPILRYDILDYAVPAPACVCGRGLPSISRIMGRRRNLLRLPTGETHWPLTGFKDYAQIAPIRQYQLIQKSLRQIEVRLVTDRPLTDAEETGLTRVIQQSLGYPFELQFSYLDNIPRPANGKFEEFVSQLS